jgi:hypothetical protein
VQAAATALKAGTIGGLLRGGLVVGGVAMPSTVLALTVTVASSR